MYSVLLYRKQMVQLPLPLPTAWSVRVFLDLGDPSNVSAEWRFLSLPRT